MNEKKKTNSTHPNCEYFVFSRELKDKKGKERKEKKKKKKKKGRKRIFGKKT
jgi:hypothetical protein